MNVESETQRGFDRIAYEKAFGEIESLTDRLPESAVLSLAREVVVRLAAKLPPPSQYYDLPSPEEIDVLCHALISHDHNAGARIISQVRDSGMSIEKIYLVYLAAAARRLGEFWDDDQASFMQVTIGASRIYAILQSLRPGIAAPLPRLTKSAVFALVPGDNHSLGIRMAADLFRGRGWNIQMLVGLSHEALVAELTQSEAPLIGLSASSRKSLMPLIRLIVALRVSNPSARIMVSGNLAVTNIDLVSICGADGIAVDIDSATREMDRLTSVS